MRRRALLTGVSASLGAALAGCASFGSLFGDQQTRSDERTYDVEAGTRLRVRNQNGPVTVEGFDGDALEVDIDVRGPTEASLDAVSVTGGRDGDNFDVATVYDDSGDDRASVDLSVRVPDGVHVARAQTTNGDLRVTGASGGGEFATRNGDVLVRDFGGGVDAQTTNGDVTVRNVETFGGATTTQGDVEVDVPALASDATAHTENGSVDAALASGLDAAVSATTTNGTVELDGVDLQDAETSRTSVTGTLGGGTFDLSFETTNGDVTLRSLSGD